MGGYATYDQMINGITTLGQYTDYNFYKISPVPTALYLHSAWFDPGFPGAAPTPPLTPGIVHDGNGTSNYGGMNFPSVSPLNRWMLGLGGSSTLQNVNIFIMDRLVTVGGVNLVGTGSKTINSAGLPLRAMTGTPVITGGNVQAFLEIVVPTTTSAAVVNMNSYTNSSGVAARVGGNFTFPSATMKAGDLMGPLPLQAGDTGISAISTINLTTAPAAGTCNLVLLRQIAHITTILGQWNEKDLVLGYPCLPSIPDNACIMLAWNGLTATATNVWGRIITGYI